MFSTLELSQRLLEIAPGRSVVLIDTVGFIRDLPENLQSAFRATLEELRLADLILHVADWTHPEIERQISTVRGVIDSLGLAATPRLLLLNKTDRFEDPDLGRPLATALDGIPMSALSPQDVRRVRDQIAVSVLRTGLGVVEEPKKPPRSEGLS